MYFNTLWAKNSLGPVFKIRPKFIQILIWKSLRPRILLWGWLRIKAQSSARDGALTHMLWTHSLSLSLLRILPSEIKSIGVSHILHYDGLPEHKMNKSRIPYDWTKGRPVMNDSNAKFTQILQVHPTSQLKESTVGFLVLWGWVNLPFEFVVKFANL